MFASFTVFGQENFDGVTAPALPTGWTQFETGTGTVQSWQTTNLATFTYGGVGNAALINRENVTSGLAIDWLVTNQITVPANGQLRFQTKTVQSGIQGSLFDIKISKISQTNPADFANIVSYDEASLTSTANVYEEKVIDLPAATYPAGTLIYIAFVMTNDNGDRWLIDNVNVVQKCNTPIGPLATSGGTTNSTILSWGNPGGITVWDVQVCPFADTFGGASTITYNNVAGPPFTATGLQPCTLYKFQVRSVCSNGTGDYESDWFGPRSFQTVCFGETCGGPIVIPPALPYQTTDNTANYADTNDIAQPLACSGTATNYMAGNDVFYTYTPTFTGNIAINLAPTATGSSIHVYSACPGTAGANCLAGVANTTANPRNINPFPVVAGTTYYIIVSSSTLNQTVGYTLTIQQVFCNQPTGLTATVTPPTTANLAWAPNAGTTSWQYSVAPAPYGLPTGAGTTTTSNTTNNFTGIPGVVYEYYVRADCNDGNFSTWTGPFAFTIPQVATPLNFTDGFETITGWTLNNATQTNKWAVGTGINNGGTHSLYITDTYGGTNTYNNVATTVVQAYKDFIIPAGATQLDLTFDWRSNGEAADYFRVWTVPTTFNPTAGTQITALANSRIKVGNDLTGTTNFTTSNYTLNATPYAGSTMRLVFEWRNNNTAGNQPPAAIDNVKLDLITCPKPGSLVVSNILYNSGQLTWTNGATETQWEVIVLPAGSAAPTATSVGVVTNSNTYSITGLTSVTCYDVYVRAKCSPTQDSFWSVPATFCTTPNYCGGDHFYDSGGATGNYQNSENITSIICPNNAGDVVTVVFNSFSLAAGDNLVIRDGNLPTSPIVGTYSGTNIPPSFSASATNTSGCLTFVFTSTASGVSAGWNATIYCTPPITCFKPVALTANPIGATTATLSWTESGSATQWEILILPFGANPPVLGQSGIPVNGTPTYIATNLTPSTTYTYYVRAICSSSNASFWSDGFTFSTTPINDLCANATTAIVNDDLNCTQLNSGTLFGSTNTAGVPAGCTPTANDVWYRFVATRSTHTFSLSNILPAGADADFALYSGTNCSALTQVQCFAAAQNVLNNLVVGQTYYIRVFSGSNQQFDFNLCIGGVPCPESVSLCNAPTTYPNTTNVINLGSYGCLGSSPNASFFFLEAAQNGTLAYTISQTSGDVDYALWGPFPSRNAGCGLIPNGSPVQCSYSTAAVENFSVNVLQGQVYILMVTNFVNTAGTITITPNPTNTAQSFCYPYNTFNYSATTYCNSAPNESPTLIAGAVAGTYSAVRVEDGSTTAMVINPTTGEINFVLSQPGTYTVTNTLIPNLPAPASNAPIVCTRTVIITPTPNATIAYGSATYCKSNVNSQAIMVTGNSGDGASYSSTPTGLENALDPVTGSLIPVLGNVGIYTIKLTVPAQGGCPEYTVTTQVEIIAAPVIPAQVDVNACNNYVLPALAAGSNYYTATGGATGTGTMLNAGDVISTNQTIYVYATNGQCSAEDPFNVNIISIPTPTFNYLTQPTCAIQTGSIQITSPIGTSGTVPTNLFISEVTDANSGALTYVELFNGTGAPINLAGYKLRTFNNGSGTVTGGCDNVLSGTIANNSTVVIKLSSDANIPGVTPNLTFTTCSAVNDNDNIRLTTTANVLVDLWGPTTNTSFTPLGQPGYTFRRLPGAATLPSTTWNPSEWTAIDPENYSNLGQYSLNIASYEYSVDNGTYQSSTIFTGLTPGPHSFVVHDFVNGCYSAPIPFTIDAVPYTTAVTDFTYTTPVCITNATNPTPTPGAGFTTGGTYSYVGTGLDLNATTGEINLAASTGATYVVTYTYPEDLANCIHGGSSNFTITIDPFVTATFTQISNICQNATAPTLPTTSNNGIVGTWTPALINTSTSGTTTYTFNPNPGQCGVGTTMNITIDPIVVPTFTAIANICLNGVAPALQTTSNNGITGTWNPATINTVTAGTSSYVFTPTAGQCSQVVTISVTIDPQVGPTFTAIPDLCVGDANVTLPTTSLNGIDGSWSPAVVNTSTAGTVVYTFTPDVSECASISTMSVYVELCEIQKGISPNGDGMNDYLELIANKVQIFNRFGKEVYTKSNYNNDWHGQFMGGGEMPDGTYYYVIELSSGSEKKTGWIYINRQN